MENVLVPVDGSDISLRAVQHLIEQIGQGRQAAVVLLNVQPPILSVDIKYFVSKDLSDQYSREEGEKALRQARAALEAAGVPYESHVRVGHSAESIVDTAREKACPRICMGGSGDGAVLGMLLGSVTTKVLGLATMPVTVVK